MADEREISRDEWIVKTMEIILPWLLTTGAGLLVSLLKSIESKGFNPREASEHIRFLKEQIKAVDRTYPLATGEDKRKIVFDIFKFYIEKNGIFMEASEINALIELALVDNKKD